MTRMADRVFFTKLVPPVWLADDTSPAELRELHEGLKEALSQGVIIEATNVSEYLNTATEQEDWNYTVDFPSVAPPFPLFWIEMRLPTRIVSAKYGVTEIPGGGRETYGILFNGEDVSNEEGIRWRLEAVLYHDHGDKAITGPLVHWTFKVRPDGSIPEYPDYVAYLPTGATVETLVAPQLAAAYKPSMEGARRLGFEYAEPVTMGDFLRYFKEHYSPSIFPALLAISFMHCKNVTVVPNEPPPKLSRAHQRRHKHPLLRFYTLQIDPMKEVLRREGKSDEVGLQRALHICRGHFKDYRAGAGLFGRHQGLYWWDSLVRGSMREGVVIKDYDVQTGQGPTRREPLSYPGSEKGD